jgi:D-3-phosphoglycerate dehydrogenase
MFYQESLLMKHIFVLDAFHPAGITLLSKKARVTNWRDPEVGQWVDKADAVLVRMTPINRDQIFSAKRLQAIGKQGVGVDTIDINAAAQRGVRVFTTPGINSEAVAEMAFSLGLAVCRRIARFDRLLRSGVPIVRPEHLGIEMQGKTVGVIGMGNIGTRVAQKWIGAFNCKILTYDPLAPADAWHNMEHVRIDKLDKLLPQIDLLTLHLPLTDESHHLISSKELFVMKSNAVLVNVSRGGIVDEKALYEALKAGHLFGVGLDVFEQEPFKADNPLAEFENVVFTPHAAAGTHETQERSSLQVARQVLQALNLD